MTQKLPYSVERLTKLSDTIYQLLLNPPEDQNIQYFAGQYVMVSNHTGEARPYSIANAPLGGKHIELHIRHTDKNDFTKILLNDINDSLPITLQGAFGKCIFNNIPEKPLIFMAGGTGFSHSKALIEHIISHKPNNAIHLFWVAKTPADLYLASLASRWQQQLAHFKFTPIISNINEGWQGCTERIEHAVVLAYPDLHDTIIYASGPQEMVFDALYHFEQHGLARENMFSDAFEWSNT